MPIVMRVFRDHFSPELEHAFVQRWYIKKTFCDTYMVNLDPLPKIPGCLGESVLGHQGAF